jgi:hypothetical protein
MDLADQVNTLDPGLVAATLINVYTHHMKALSNLFFSKCKIEDFSLVKNKLKLLGQDKRVIDAINNEEFWNYLCRHPMACEKVGHNVIFYKMRFVDWLKEYITEAK